MKKKEPKSKNKTTKEDFETFKKEFLSWVARFGLQDWELLFIHKDVDSEARVDLFWTDKVANVTMSIDWADHVISKDSITQAARHEAIHLALGVVDHLAHDRHATEKELEIAVEDAVRRISTGIGSILEEER